MPDDGRKTKAQLLDEVQELRGRVDRLEGMVTEHRRTEKELRRSEEMLKTITETAEDAIFIKDADSRYTFVNPALERALGRPASELMGKTPGQVFSEEDAAIVASVDESVLDGEVINTERTLNLEGNDRAFHALQAPVFDSTGKVCAICGIVRDVTERKLAEEALRESEERAREQLAELEQIYDAAPIGLSLVDADLRYLRINERLAAMNGRPVAEHLGHTVMELLPGLADTLDSTYRRVIETQKPILDFEVQGTTLADPGREHHWVVSYLPLTSEATQVQGVLAVVSDITERKRAESALQQAQEDLEERVLERTKQLLESNAKLRQEKVERGRAEEERERLAKAIEQTSDTVIITDAEATIQYVNPAFERLTGYTREEANGQNTRMLRSGEHDEAFYEEMWNIITRGETWSGRLVNRRKDGTLFTEEATISPVRDDSDQTVNYVAVKRDVTHEVELAARLRHAQKMEDIGALAGGIAHNLKNSLGVILGWVEIAVDHITEDGVVLTSLGRATNAGKRATDLLKQLMKFSRKAQTKHKPIRLGPVVNEGLAFLRGLLPPTIELCVNIDENCGCVMADPSEIQQVLLNLGTNASQAMKGNGVLEVALVKVEMTPEEAGEHLDLKEGKYVQLSVSDTGHGMSGEMLERAFEPFFTTKEPGEGTGLGLSVVHGIVREHGGEIQVQSEIGEGTSFIVLLPACAEEETKPENPKDARG